jgi:hypothetical protein
MNLRSRLKKLENEVIDDSTVCACDPQRYEIYYQDLSKNAKTNEPILRGEPAPDVCPNCRKPAEKNSITVQFVDGTTKDRFPELWNANRNK